MYLSIDFRQTKTAFWLCCVLIGDAFAPCKLLVQARRPSASARLRGSDGDVVVEQQLEVARSLGAADPHIVDAAIDAVGSDCAPGLKRVIECREQPLVVAANEQLDRAGHDTLLVDAVSEPYSARSDGQGAHNACVYLIGVQLDRLTSFDGGAHLGQERGLHLTERAHDLAQVEEAHLGAIAEKHRISSALKFTGCMP